MLELCTVQSKGQIDCMFALRHFSLDATNLPGNCSLPTCSLTPTPGTLSHILTKCKDLEPARERVLSLWAAAAQDNPTIQPILTQYSTTTDTALFVQFLLDCTVLPEVIVQSQIEGKKCRKADMHQHRWIVVHRFKQNNKVLNWKLYHILYQLCF